MVCFYHTLIETYNIVHYNSVEKIRKKLVIEKKEDDRILRSKAKDHLAVIKRPKESCVGFTYFASKLWNKLPDKIRNSKSSQTFKIMVKTWILDKNVPACVEVGCAPTTGAS